MKIRRANERGYADHGWLKSFHTFSFADYYDPQHMGYRALRVINEDRVAGGQGFGRHGHKDMEIVSYVLDGALEHADSLGTGSVIRPGDVQRMSAGTGVVHSEKNHSDTEGVHFLQIWIVPSQRNVAPGYEQKSFPTEQRQGKLRVVASSDGREGSLTVHQDVSLYAGLFGEGEAVEHALAKGRGAWVHVVRGQAKVNGEILRAGDAAQIEDEAIRLEGTTSEGGKPAEVLLFDLA